MANKLTEDRLTELVKLRKEKGFKNIVPVLEENELSAYRNNCIEAIERLTTQIERLTDKSHSPSMLAICEETLEVVKENLAELDARIESSKTSSTEGSGVFDVNSKNEKVEAITINELFESNNCITKNKQIVEMLNQRTLVTQWNESDNSYYVVGTKNKIIYIRDKKIGNVMSVWN